MSLLFLRFSIFYMNIIDDVMKSVSGELSVYFFKS